MKAIRANTLFKNLVYTEKETELTKKLIKETMLRYKCELVNFSPSLGFGDEINSICSKRNLNPSDCLALYVLSHDLDFGMVMVLPNIKPEEFVRQIQKRIKLKAFL